MIPAPSLKWEIQRIRRKLQLERLLKGFAIVFAFFIVASIASSYLLAQYNFSDSAILWARVAGGAGLAFLALKLLILPAFRWPSPQRVARFLEERHPGLQDRVSTAVDIRESPGTVHPAIRELIERDAASKLQTCDRPVLYHQRASLTSLLATVVSLVAFLALFWSGPEAYRYSLDKLLSRAGDSQPPLYSITVTPGNAKVVRHADVEIRAVLSGFDSQDVKLQAKYENRPAWEEAAMRPAPEGNGFVFLFFDARERIDYFVEADGIRSPQYTITVSEVPAVEKLEVTLHFPRHTGLKSEVKEDDGDIRALIGTRAEFSVKTDQPVMGGAIKLEEGGELILETAAPNHLTGSLTVKTDDFYRIRLRNMEGVWSFASDEYVIEALEDQPPSISFTRPGRDQRVTNLEEVFTEVKAEDDYGVRNVTLHYSVNGAPNQKVDLDAPRYARSLTTSHTFYLEEFELQPGDFVSYFAEAADAVSTAATDLYFLEIEPYDREYYQSQQSGGGGGRQEDMMLAKFQKEIIVATFNVLRDEKQASRQEFEENVQTVALMQQQLKQQAETILDRLQRRGAATDTEMFRKMKEHLSQAVVHMGEAHQLLTQFKAQEALPDEQLAYQQLLRAEALFKEIQLSMGQDGQGGGNSSAEDLADLVDLELDKTKNQYETLQQNRENQADQELDEAARKLKELAQRQQQEVERKKRQASQSGSGSSSQDLLEEIEEMARQLERLSRQKRDRQLNDISRQLKQAARDLRQSQKGGNPQEAQMRAQRALERLQKARDALNRQRESEMSDSVRQLSGEARRLVQEQQELVKRIEDLEDKQKQGRLDSNFTKELRDLVREKAGMQEDLQQLEGDLHRTAKRLGSKEPDAARKLKQAGNDVRDHRIPDKMQEGSELLRRGWTSMARQREQSVEEDLRQLAENVREAEEAMGRGNPSDPRERAERALNQMGELVENLESLRQRAENQSSEQGRQQEGREQSGQQGEEGREQPGQQQGQGGEQSRDSQQSGEQSGQQGQPSDTRQGQQGQQGQPSDSQGRGDPRQTRDGEPVQAGGNNTGPPSQTEGTQRQAERSSMAANSGGINPTRLRREWRERVMDAQRIQDLLKGFDPRRARDVAQLARRMREIDASRIFNDPEEVARLKAQIIEGFRQLELDLYRNLKQDEEQLRLSNEEEVPPQFRDRVEEYYRALAGARPKEP